jgi:chemotaxis protein CheC
MIDISDNQYDALLELFNVGVGQAASSLSLIVREEVMMSVPKIELLHSQAQKENFAIAGGQRICAVSQHFSGPFEADTMLIFPEDKTMLIVKKMIGGVVAAQDISEMEQDALTEIGNIVLNTCVSSLGDTFCKKFNGSTPTYRLGHRNEIIDSPSTSEGVILALHIDLFMKKDEIHGYLVFLLNVLSYEKLLENIDALLARYST